MFWLPPQRSASSSKRNPTHVTEIHGLVTWWYQSEGTNKCAHEVGAQLARRDPILLLDVR